MYNLEKVILVLEVAGSVYSNEVLFNNNHEEPVTQLISSCWFDSNSLDKTLTNELR